MRDCGSSRPAQILQVAASYLPDVGGLETHVAEVASRLSELPTINVTVSTTDRHQGYPLFDFSGAIPVVRCRAWPANRDYYFAPGLARIIRRGNWDLVHIQGVHTLAPVIGMWAARRARVPYVVTFHSGGATTGIRRALRSVQWSLLAPLLLGAEKLVAVSRSEQRHFADALCLAPEQIAVIKNGGGLPTLKVSVRPVPGRILSIGRLQRYKGHHRAIEALPAIRRLVPDAHLHILGSGPYERELRALAARLGVADEVTIRLVPPGDRQAMAICLAEAAVVSALSDYEAHPVAVMEALAAGVPVVGIDAAGIGDLVEDGFVTGLPASASAAVIADALIQAMAGRRPVPVALPTWEQATEQLTRMYNEILGERLPTSLSHYRVAL